MTGNHGMRSVGGGERMLFRYMEVSNLSLEEIYNEMDREYIN